MGGLATWYRDMPCKTSSVAEDTIIDWYLINWMLTHGSFTCALLADILRSHLSMFVIVSLCLCVCKLFEVS